MPWNSTSPDGTKSVKANTPTMQQNTTYTETTLNADHFWNIGVDEDGHHKQVQCPKLASDLVLSAGMDGGMYYKEVSASNSQVQGFYRNVNGIYQFIPCFKSGDKNLTSSYVNVVAVEANSYGQIWMFKNDNSDNVAMAFFQAGTTTCQAYACTTQFSSSSTAGTNLKFGNGGSASGLNIRARTQDASSGTYFYRLIYWGV